MLPNIVIIGVEAVGADSVVKSLEQNKIVTIPPPSTIADGIRTVTPGMLITIRQHLVFYCVGTLTMPIIKNCVDQVVLIEDADIIEAMKFAVSNLSLHTTLQLFPHSFRSSIKPTLIIIRISRMKLVLEPTGATAMAAVMKGLVPANLKKVGVVLCGGNVDTKFLGEILINT